MGNNAGGNNRQLATVIRQAAHAAPVAHVAPVVAANPVAPVASATPAAEVHISGLPLTVDEAVRQLESIQDKNAKKDYIHTLPQPMQVEVIAAIKAAKEAEKSNASRAQLDSELDALL
ncbi:MAG: hypothetical protein NTY60_04715 [Proteobacteria bacterium]|nr:hypothetical protein [Pseudomonadota bacterium]